MPRGHPVAGDHRQPKGFLVGGLGLIGMLVSWQCPKKRIVIRFLDWCEKVQPLQGLILAAAGLACQAIEVLSERLAGGFESPTYAKGGDDLSSGDSKVFLRLVHQPAEQ